MEHQEGFESHPPDWPSYPNSLSSIFNSQNSISHPTNTLPGNTGISPTYTSSSPTYSSTSGNPLPISSNDSNPNDGLWTRLSPGARVGVIVSGIAILLLIILASTWFCCGCCGYRRRRARNNEIRNPRPDTDTVPLRNTPPQTQTQQYQMQTQPPTQIQVQARGGAGSIGRMNSTATLPPPLYTEYTPPQHTTIAGGITHVREEEEGVISDGKMPLSEIPFEDVVLSHSHSSSMSGSGSGSEARNFHGTHRGYGGDVTGHTNS